VPMRSAVFGSHLKPLKSSTKAFYESYRTEKLLVRKARQMGYVEGEGAKVDAKPSMKNSTVPSRSKSVERGPPAGARFVVSSRKDKGVTDDWIDVGNGNGPGKIYNHGVDSLGRTRSDIGHGGDRNGIAH